MPYSNTISSMSSTNEIRILEEQLVYENSYGRLYDDQVYFETSEEEGTYVRWEWKAPFSVGVLPLTSGEVTLIRAFRHSARTQTIEIPKGFGEVGETPEDAARRELAEEAGLIAERMEYLGEVASDPAFSNHPFHLFVAFDCTTAARTPDSTEVIDDVKIVQRSEVLDVLAGSNGPVDAITLLALHLAARF